jgi:hypothetical protein
MVFGATMETWLPFTFSGALKGVDPEAGRSWSDPNYVYFDRPS